MGAGPAGFPGFPLRWGSNVLQSVYQHPDSAESAARPQGTACAASRLLMNAASRELSPPVRTSPAPPDSDAVAPLADAGFRAGCAEEGRALSRPRDAYGQGGFSDQGQQQVLSEENQLNQEKAANP
jgi:hypothetical protein